MRGPILVSLKTLCQLYPMYTKAGKVWKNRTDWSKIEIPGMIIVTQFGIFTFIKAERINKEWYWTLLSMNGFYYTIKRDQARWNKKMPKKPLRKYAYQASAKPISILNKLFEQAKEVGDVVVLEVVGGTWEEWCEEYRLPEYTEEEAMIAYIAHICTSRGVANSFFNERNEFYKVERLSTVNVYKQLAKVYHPDVNTHDTTKIFQHITHCFKNNN